MLSEQSYKNHSVGKGMQYKLAHLPKSMSALLLYSHYHHGQFTEIMSIIVSQKQMWNTGLAATS